MALGHFAAPIIGLLLILTDVGGECVKEDNEKLISLHFKKQDKMQDEMTGIREETSRMREKMQDEMTGVREEMSRMREKMQVELAGLKENMQEEINKLRLERMKEHFALLGNKPSETLENGSNNETSLALAVLQLSSTIENLQSDRGDVIRQSQGYITEQNGLSEIRRTLEDLQANVEDLGDVSGQNMSLSNNATNVHKDLNQVRGMVEGLQVKMD
ncbi:unnamed protein product, partial [Meganyctiphanes norvegica]